jgi:acetylornithine/N-succinyldiaminopimelate aminotransferase
MSEQQKSKETLIMEEDGNYIAPIYSRYPLVLEKGKGVTVWDAEGRSYLDFTSGIGVNCLGFCDEAWGEAVFQQLKTLQHCSNLYYTKPAIQLAKLLTQRTGMRKVFFCNSGAEANECAIKIARKHGNAKGKGADIITLWDSFHGRTMATITATGQEHYHHHFHPFVPGFHYVTPRLEEVKDKLDQGACGILLEIIQGEGGVRVLAPEFLKGAADLCRKRGALFMVDEVQTGTGRTGALFAYQKLGLKPDLVTFAKGMGGGLPMGGVLMNRVTENVLVPGDHGTTFGANPAICAGALEVLNRLTPEFLEEVNGKGEYLRDGLLSIPGVEDVEGMGLMWGFRVRGKAVKEVVAAALPLGLLLLTAQDKIRLLPPLIISVEELEKGLKILQKAIGGKTELVV